MFPFDKKDKKPCYPSLFQEYGGFGDFFREFDIHAEKLIQEAQKQPGNSFVYGYSSYTGPDGKPVVSEFSNIPGFKGSCNLNECDNLQIASEQSNCELFHDILDEGKNLKVIVDLPGVEKKDIHIQACGRKLSIDAQKDDRKYSGEIHLPDIVSAKPHKASYKNGVLEVIFKKEDDKTDIKVE